MENNNQLNYWAQVNLEIVAYLSEKEDNDLIPDLLKEEDIYHISKVFADRFTDCFGEKHCYIVSSRDLRSFVDDSLMMYEDNRSTEWILDFFFDLSHKSQVAILAQALDLMHADNQRSKVDCIALVLDYEKHPSLPNTYIKTLKE